LTCVRVFALCRFLNNDYCRSSGVLQAIVLPRRLRVCLFEKKKQKRKKEQNSFFFLSLSGLVFRCCYGFFFFFFFFFFFSLLYCNVHFSSSLSFRTARSHLALWLHASGNTKSTPRALDAPIFTSSKTSRARPPNKSLFVFFQIYLCFSFRSLHQNAVNSLNAARRRSSFV
jgi:hypothetical protein